MASPSTPQAAPSLTEQYEYAQSRGVPWLVIINASTFGGAPGAGAAGLGRLPTQVLQAGHGGRLQRTAKPGPPCPRPPPLACAQARALCASRP